VIVLTRADVEALLDLDELVDAVGGALADLSAGRASMPPRIAALVPEVQGLLGWRPRYSNAEALTRTYDWYLANRNRISAAGTTHRVPWNQRALGLLRRLS